MSAAEARELRLTARRTWRFFETFVTAEDHALPPDNFQDDPKPVVAHRTSPTNLGLYLLAAVAARDFGWLGTADCVARLEETLDTMGRLEPHRGHLFNWYETRDLRALAPRYISTVDSGNLAGHLLTLAGACDQLRGQPLLGPQTLLGIGDAVELIRASAPASAGHRTQTVTRRQLDEALDALAPALDPAVPMPATPAAWGPRLEAIAHGLHAVVDVARALAREQQQGADAAAWAEALAWAELAQGSAESHQRDLPADAAAGLLPSASLVHRLEGISPLRHRDVRRHGLQLPLRPGAEAVLDRLPGGHRRARRRLLRPARLRGAPGQLPRHRQGGGAGGALVPARPRADAGQPGALR